MKILCICLSSTLQRTISFKELKLTEVNRSQHYRLDASGKAVNSARVLNQLEKEPSPKKLRDLRTGRRCESKHVLKNDP